MAAAENPIERRLEQLYDHWEALIDDEPARLLCWRVAAHEFRCVEAFFAAEDDERAGQLPVVFLRFEDPFDDPLHYAAVLRGRLLEAIELAREDEPDPDDPPVSLDTFAPPPPTGDTVHDLMATAEEPQLVHVEVVEMDPLGLDGGLHGWNFVSSPFDGYDLFGLFHHNDPGHYVYGLYDPAPPRKGQKPYYVGITNDQGVRANAHRNSGRLSGDARMRKLDGPVTYDQARGYEQAYIEHHKTKTGTPGQADGEPGQAAQG